MELAVGIDLKSAVFARQICHWISAAVGAVACSGMSPANSVAEVILYASASQTAIDGSKEIQLDLVHAGADAMQRRRCEHLTLVLAGIRATKVDATGARLTLGGTSVGSFSLYGFENGARRSLSFLLPPSAASFSSLPATLGLNVQLLDHQSGSLAVDSFRIVCLKA